MAANPLSMTIKQAAALGAMLDTEQYRNGAGAVFAPNNVKTVKDMVFTGWVTDVYDLPGDGVTFRVTNEGRLAHALFLNANGIK